MDSEILDIIDKDDKVIGTATREECHNNPKLLHHTVHFTLFDSTENTVLLTQRSLKKKHDAGKYCFLGEHIISGESYEHAIIRGVKEETGISVSKFAYLTKQFFTYQKESELVKFFVCEYNAQELKFPIDEVEKYLWISVTELKNTKLNLSEMTRYWVDNIDWTKIKL